MSYQSTIDPLKPVQNAPVASNVVRANFKAAYDDINALGNIIGGLTTGVSSFNGRGGDVVLQDSDVNNALGFDPSIKMGNLQWVNPIVTAVPISLIPYAEYQLSITRLNNLALSAGSLTLSFFINGAPIAGLSALGVTTSPINPIATANNSMSVGDELTMTVTAPVSVANLKFSMRATV